MIRISSDTYGETAHFPTLEEAQSSIRACGVDFQDTVLTERGGLVYDETGTECGGLVYDETGASMPERRLAWSLDALEVLGFAALMAGRQWTPGDAARAAELVERARELGLMAEEDPRT